MTGRRLRSVLAAALLLSAPLCAAAEDKSEAVASAPAWEFSATGYYYQPRGQDSYLSGIATAQRGPVHLEARYNYEALDSGSLFAGWKFSGGEVLTYEVTPILGGVFGAKQGIAPGLEATLAYGALDFYIEAEYVRDLQVRQDSFAYAWSELGVSPVQWLRFGLAAQRTRVYRSDRDIQRGGFAQLTVGKAKLGLYVFNPDDTDNRLVIFSVGADW